MAQEEQKKYSRKFSGFEVSLISGNKKKKQLCNNLKISVPTPVTDVSINLTLRQAQALKKFLDDTLSQ